jgi:hypothetical protein
VQKLREPPASCRRRDYRSCLAKKAEDPTEFRGSSLPFKSLLRSGCGLGLELLHIERAARHMPLGRRQMTLNISSSLSSSVWVRGAPILSSRQASLSTSSENTISSRMMAGPRFDVRITRKEESTFIVASPFRRLERQAPSSWLAEKPETRQSCGSVVACRRHKPTNQHQ